MKKKIIIGLACLTAGIGLAGCAGSNEQPTEATTTAETTTAAETTTTTAETTTTTQETTTEALTEAWMAKYSDALVFPKQNPDEVWGEQHKIEICLNNGIHLYLPSFFDNWYEGAELVIAGYGVRTDNNEYIDYYKMVDRKVYSGEDFFNVNTNTIFAGATDDHLRIKGEIGDRLPSNDNENKYREIAEKDGKVYYIDFSPMIWDGGDSRESYTEYLSKFEDKIVNSAWVEKKAEALTEVAKSHPEDEQIMENLRAFYKSHEIVDGVPTEISNSETRKYLKYSIADFDGDGENELAIEDFYKVDMYEFQNTYIYKSNVSNLTRDNAMEVMDYKQFSDITFLDNGIAYCANAKSSTPVDSRDKGVYYLINDDYYGKLNYSKDNVGDNPKGLGINYFIRDGVIIKNLGTVQDFMFQTEKTWEQYEADMDILNSGNVMNIEVKDFTAENIGL